MVAAMAMAIVQYTSLLILLSVQNISTQSGNKKIQTSAQSHVRYCDIESSADSNYRITRKFQKTLQM